MPKERAARERNPEADSYPVFERDALALMCYPTLTGEADRNRRATLANKVRAALVMMGDRGYCAIEEVGAENGPGVNGGEIMYQVGDSKA